MKTTVKEMLGEIKLPLVVKSERVPLGETGEFDDNTNIRDATGSIVCGNWNQDDENERKMAYLVHAANVLPDLIEALERTRGALVGCHPRLNITAYEREAGEAINRAKTVEI